MWICVYGCACVWLQLDAALWMRRWQALWGQGRLRFFLFTSFLFNSTPLFLTRLILPIHPHSFRHLAHPGSWSGTNVHLICLLISLWLSASEEAASFSSGATESSGLRFVITTHPINSLIHSFILLIIYSFIHLFTSPSPLSLTLSSCSWSLFLAFVVSAIREAIAWLTALYWLHISFAMARRCLSSWPRMRSEQSRSCWDRDMFSFVNLTQVRWSDILTITRVDWKLR